MLKLIVNADDFGLSEKVNEGIVSAHRNGIVKSASLMANGTAFDHAITCCAVTPTLDIGVHLNLVEEQPVLDTHQVPSLVDRKGRLPRHAKNFVRRYFAGQISLQEIRE